MGVARVLTRTGRVEDATGQTRGDVARGGGRSDATHAPARRTPAPAAGRDALGGLPVRVPELIIGVLLVAGCALAAVVWHRALTSGRPVVVAAADIPRGSVVDPDDLTTVDVRGAGDTVLVPAQDASTLIGQFALVDIAGGTPLSDAIVSPLTALRDDEVLGSVALDRGHAPVDLAAGDTVRVVVVPDPTVGEATEPRMLDRPATVWMVIPPTDYDDRTVVTLRLPVQHATTVAGADDVRLVRVEG